MGPAYLVRVFYGFSISDATNASEGICMAIDLIKRNKCHNFVILEKSSSVGGTWHDNKYPGCCCDGILSTVEHILLSEADEDSLELAV